jgi:hypothetical protein
VDDVLEENLPWVESLLELFFHPVCIGHLTNTEIGQVSKQEIPQMRDAPEEFFFYTESRLRLET